MIVHEEESFVELTEMHEIDCIAKHFKVSFAKYITVTCVAYRHPERDRFAVYMRPAVPKNTKQYKIRFSNDIMHMLKLEEL